MKDKSPVCGSLTPLLKTLNLLNVRMSYGKHTSFYFGSKVITFDEARREYTHIHTHSQSQFSRHFLQPEITLQCILFCFIPVS